MYKTYHRHGLDRHSVTNPSLALWGPWVVSECLTCRRHPVRSPMVWSVYSPATGPPRVGSLETGSPRGSVYSEWAEGASVCLRPLSTDNLWMGLNVQSGHRKSGGFGRLYV